MNKEKKEVVIWVEPTTIWREHGDDNVIGHSTYIPKGHKILSGSIVDVKHIEDSTTSRTEYSVVLLTYDPRYEEAEG